MGLIKSQESLFPLSALHHVRMQQEAESPQPGKGPSPELDHAGTLILALQTPQTVKSKLVLMSCTGTLL